MREDEQTATALEHYVDFGGTGPLVHLATANGFPPETYRPLVDPLTAQQQVVGYVCRPLWPGSEPSEIDDWRDLANDLLRDLAALDPDGPVVGVGHSLGGIITVYAALLQPERFRALVLIDAVLLPNYQLRVLWLLHKLGLHRRPPLVQNALRRRAHFPDAATVHERYQGRGIFTGWDPAALEGYISGGVRPAADGGVRLAWPPEWEAHIFSLIPHDAWDAVAKVSQPLLIIRGSASDVITDPAWAKLHDLLPHATLVEVEGGHMVPMQNPQAVATAVQAFLNDVA